MMGHIYKNLFNRCGFSAVWMCQVGDPKSAFKIVCTKSARWLFIRRKNNLQESSQLKIKEFT